MVTKIKYSILIIFFLISCDSISKTEHERITKRYAEQVSNKFMKSICPNTGRNSYYKILSYHFDQSKKEYRINMESYWYGKTNIFSDEYKFEIDGVLSINENREYEFDIIYKNEAVEDAERNNEIFNSSMKIIDSLEELSKLESEKNY